jgi:hypothetical protein
VQAPGNDFVIDKAGMQDSGLFRATAGGRFFWPKLLYTYGFFGFFEYRNAICTRKLQGENRLRAEVHAPSVALAPIA